MNIKLFTEKFLTALKTRAPQLTSLANLLTPPGTLILNSNLNFRTRADLFPLSSRFGQNPYGIIAEANILKGRSIFMVSTDVCATSLEFTGADSARSHKLQQLLRSSIDPAIIGSTNPYLQDDLYTTFKVVIQLLANQTAPDLPLHGYLNCLKGTPTSKGLARLERFALDPEFLQFFKSNTVRGYVLGKFEAAKNTRLKLGQGLISKSLDDIYEMECLTRSRSVSINDNTIFCPLVDLLSEGLLYNCELEGVHSTHNNKSYVHVKATRQIQSGQEIVLKSENKPNLDLFCSKRIVFQTQKSKSSSQSFAVLPVSYEDVPELQEMMSFKQSLYQKFGGLQEYVKVIKGTDCLHPASRRMLRILFLTEKELFNNRGIMVYALHDFERPISEENERKINNFILKHLQIANKNRVLTELQNETSLHSDEIKKAIRYLEWEESFILLEAQKILKGLFKSAE